jgi:small subunit ribosomal protein S9
VKPGRGAIEINGRPFKDFFTEQKDRHAIEQTLAVTDTAGKVDVLAAVQGGGFTGQAGAVVLGIARALVKLDPDLEAPLRDHQMLTRDDRAKERKKYGRRGARRSFQFSKR